MAKTKKKKVVKKIIKKLKLKDKSKIKTKVKVKAKAKVKAKIKQKVKVISKVKMGKFIGRITHYFSNIDVAVIDLVAPLKVKDKIRIVGGQETDFEQKVASIQVDHKEVTAGKKGQEIGIKVAEKVHDGYKVYKV